MASHQVPAVDSNPLRHPDNTLKSWYYRRIFWGFGMSLQVLQAAICIIYDSLPFLGIYVMVIYNQPQTWKLSPFLDVSKGHTFSISASQKRQACEQYTAKITHLWHKRFWWLDRIWIWSQRVNKLGMSVGALPITTSDLHSQKEVGVMLFT